MKLNEFKDKKIIVLGLGREGRDNFLFLRKLFPQKVIGIADRKTELDFKNKKAKFHLGKNYLKALKDYDVVIKSPGIPFKNIPRSGLRKLVTQTDIFFDNCKGSIVGVTGTKGKSTTCSMIYDVLKAGKIKAHLVGNIGRPVLNLLSSAGPKDVYVYELSSHQLYNLKKPAYRQADRPHIAVFLNIFKEHLDYYRNFKEYARAKANIILYQKENDYLVYNLTDKLVRGFSQKSKAKKIKIQGDYYELDKNAARAVGKIFKIPAKTIEKAIKKFKYLPHRLESVGKFRGITFYNDALATIPEATMAAIDALGNRVETIMLGGFERNIDFKNLAKKVLQSKIKTVILFPTTGIRIWKDILKLSRSRGLPKNFFVSNMKDAVETAYQQTNPGKICLLSTASSSFSIFRDYKEKGDLFKKYVKEIGRKKNR